MVRLPVVAISARMWLAAATVVVLLGLLPLLTRQLIAVLGDPGISDELGAVARFLVYFSNFVAAKWPLLASAVGALLIAFEEHARATRGHMLEWLEPRLFALCAATAGMLAAVGASAVMFRLLV